MFDSPTPASSSSSTLVTTTTTTTTSDSASTPTSTSTSASTSTQSPDDRPNATSDTPSHKPRRPSLSVNTFTTRLGASTNSPKMSDKGFIEPHPSHLPRRIKSPPHKKARERSKNTALPTALEQQERQQQLEELREQLQCQLEPASDTQPHTLEVHPPHPNHLPAPIIIQPAKKPPQVSTHPQRDNLPRRTRVHERAKTAPMTTTTTLRTRRIPAPLPISMVDSQSTIGAETTDAVGPPSRSIVDAETLVSSPTALPFRFNSKALSLISKAQNKAFESLDDDDDDDDDDHGRSGSDGLDSRQLSSPQLPHPAMGLTMGIMEAYAAEEESQVSAGHPRPVHAFVRSGLSYSPALGVKGTPPPPLPSSVVFPVGSSRFVPLLSEEMPIPRISITKPTPVLEQTPPLSAPLGRNLPRRHHRYRRRETQSPLGARVEEEREVLRFERVGASVKEGRVEGNEEEDGLFSSLLDFGRAGSDGVGGALSASSVPSGPRGGEEDERCIQGLGRSYVEVGYMRACEAKEKDFVAIETIGDGDERRLELCLPDNAAVCREGVSSLLPEQVRAGCEFMKEVGGRRIRISVPRWRAQDAMGLAVCFLAWAEADGEKHVPLRVNDVVCLESYTPLHHLYMRLLDDGDGEEQCEWDAGVARSEKVGLGLVGVELGRREEETTEGEQSAHSTSTTGSSRPTVVLRGRGGCASEGWAGLRDEWRGVLSYEGLNALVGLWP